MINSATKYKIKEVVIKIYKSLVRPHLDYYITFKPGVHLRNIYSLEKNEQDYARAKTYRLS